MRWEDRRPGEERANNQRGCHLPETPTVPPILTPGSQPENPFAPKRNRCSKWVEREKLRYRGDNGKKRTAHSANTDRDLADQTDPGGPRQNRSTPGIAAREFPMNEHQDRKKPRSCLTRQCRK